MERLLDTIHLVTSRMTDTSAPYRPWLLGLYPVAILLIVQPIAETLAAAWPLRMSEVGWRFGVTGSFELLVGTFVVGIGLLVLAAWLLGHRIVLRAVSVSALVIACLMVLGAASFTLDVVQLRRMVRPDLLGGFQLAAGKAAVSALLAIIALAVLGYRGIVASRAPQNERAPRKRTAREGLIVGQR